MSDLMEIRIHGRGGQGAKSAAQLLAEAAMESGQYIQAFPEYGPERAGAPMQAFVRISANPITLHCGILQPSIVLVIDPSLTSSIDVTSGLDAGTLIVNSPDKPRSIREKLSYQGGTVATVDATAIALDTIEKPLPNIPILGALIKVHSLVEMDVLKNQIKKKFTPKIGEAMTKANIQGLERAYEEVKVQ